MLLQAMSAMPTPDGPRRKTDDLFASCPCGWRSLTVSNHRDARRQFERHLRKVGAGKTDLGDGRIAPDDQRAVRARQRAR